MSTNAILEKLRTERDQVRTAAVAIAEGESFNPEDANFVELETRAKELDHRIDKLQTLLTEQAAADALDGRYAKSVRSIEEQRAKHQPGGQVESRETWGTLFTRSDIFKDYRGRGQSARYEFDALQTRALPTGLGDLIAAGLEFGKTTVDVTAPPVPTPLLDAVSTINVSTNAIEYVSWAVKAGGPAVVPEKGAKPSIEYGPTVVPDTLDMIAAYTQLTRQLIEDATSVQSYIDTDLRRQILIKEESEAAGVLAGATLTEVSGANLLAAIRVAVGTVQSAGYNPNAVLLNPADYADLDIAVMGVTVNGPTVRQSFWGLTPIPSTAQPAGEAIVGDFRTGVNHFVRSAVSVYITDSHADTFLSNVFTLLAERRARTAVVRPDALAVATGGSGS
jgi:HK97 family phage major capsid protein